MHPILYWTVAVLLSQNHQEDIVTRKQIATKHIATLKILHPKFADQSTDGASYVGIADEFTEFRRLHLSTTVVCGKPTHYYAAQ